MPRFLDLECNNCGWEVTDLFVMQVPSHIIHWQCGGEMEQVLRPRAKARAQWSDKDAVVVFRDKNGKLRYPGQNTVPTPAGCERIVMRSLAEVTRFEREHGVVNEAMHFNSGNSIDSADPQPALPSRDERLRNFMRSWHS